MRVRTIAALAIALLASLSVSSQAQAQKRWALVIGNDRYERLPPLQKAVNDARTIDATLRRLGFEVSRVENATRRAMNEGIENMAGRVDPGDTALVFYAGHGVEIKGRNYLLPTDTPDAREGQEGLIGREGIAADSILERLQERGARVSMLVLDACRDNPFKRAGSRGVGGTRGLAQITAPEGVFVLFSAGFGQSALDRLSDTDPHPNSVFTRTFAGLLERPGLSVLELAKTTQIEVRKLAATVNHTQMPAFYDQIIGHYSLAPAGPAIAAPAPASPSPAIVAPPPAPATVIAALPPRSGVETTVSRSAPVFTTRAAGMGSGPPLSAKVNFPTKPISIIVPFAAGGATDITARLLAEPMSRALGQPVVIANQPGAGGSIGMAAARRAASDGHTLVLGSFANLINGVVQRAFELGADFQPVGLLAASPIVIAAKKDLPVNDLPGFIAYLRGRSASFGSGGTGTIGHLACEQFNGLIGVRATHVPSRGSAGALTDLIAGHIDYVCAEAATLAPHILANSIKPIVTASAERITALPDVPTAAEAGLPALRVSSWYALLAPRATADTIVNKLSYAVGRALDDAGTRQRLFEATGELPAAAYRSPQALDAFLRAETARWTPILKSAGVN